MKPLLKLAIAVLLLLCLVDMPYGFYQLVRFAATAAFAYLAYDNFKSQEDGKNYPLPRKWETRFYLVVR